MYGQADAEFYTNFASAFGPGTSQTLQHFVETLPLRALVDDMARGLFYTDSPLNAQHADQLVEILSSNLRNAQGRLDMSGLNADAILAQARTILSDRQLVPLQALIARLAAERDRKGAAAASGTSER